MENTKEVVEAVEELNIEFYDKFGDKISSENYFSFTGNEYGISVEFNGMRIYDEENNPREWSDTENDYALELVGHIRNLYNAEIDKLSKLKL